MNRWSKRFYAHATLYLGVAFLVQAVYLAFSSVSILNPVLSMVAAFVLFVSFFTPSRMQRHWMHRPVVALLIAVVTLFELYFTETELLTIYVLPIVPVAILLLLCRTWHAQLINALFLIASSVVVINPPPNLAQILATTFGYVLLPSITLINWFCVSLLWYSHRGGDTFLQVEDSQGSSAPYDLATVLETPASVHLEMEDEVAYDASLPLNRQPMPQLPMGKPRPMVLGTIAEVEFYHAFSTLSVSPSVHLTIEHTLPSVLVGDVFLLGGLIRWLLLHQLAADLLRGLALNFTTMQLGAKEDGELVLRVVLTTGNRKNVVLHAFDPSNPLCEAIDVWRTVHVHRSPNGSTAHFVLPVRRTETAELVSDSLDFPSAAVQAGGNRLTHARLLVLENGFNGLLPLQRAIVGCFRQLWVAADAEEAELIVSRHTVDLVLLDLEILDGKGTQLVQRIRSYQARDGRQVPIIGIVSAPDESKAWSSIGIDHILCTPVDTEVLVSLMAEALDHVAKDDWT